jgi:hypothetical protein
VTGEQDRLLCVGPEAADDEQGDAVRARGPLHPVERARDVRAHPFTLPLGQRAVVAAAGRRQRSRRREHRLRARLDRHRPPRVAGAQLEAVAHADAHAHRRE